jgi:hypothetical protein
MSDKGLAVYCRIAGSLEVPERGEKKKERRDGGNDAVTRTYLKIADCCRSDINVE